MLNSGPQKYEYKRPNYLFHAANLFSSICVWLYILINQANGTQHQAAWWYAPYVAWSLLSAGYYGYVQGASGLTNPLASVSGWVGSLLRFINGATQIGPSVSEATNAFASPEKGTITWLMSAASITVTFLAIFSTLRPW